MKFAFIFKDMYKGLFIKINLYCRKSLQMKAAELKEIATLELNFRIVFLWDGLGRVGVTRKRGESLGRLVAILLVSRFLHKVARNQLCPDCKGQGNQD